MDKCGTTAILTIRFFDVAGRYPTGSVAIARELVSFLLNVTVPHIPTLFPPSRQYFGVSNGDTAFVNGRSYSIGAPRFALFSYATQNGGTIKAKEQAFLTSSDRVDGDSSIFPSIKIQPESAT